MGNTKKALRLWGGVGIGLICWLLSVWLLSAIAKSQDNIGLIALADYVYGWLFWPTIILLFIYLWNRRRKAA